MLSKYEIAKYPFLTDARDFIGKLGYDLYEFDESMAYILDRSIKRIWIALNGEVFSELGNEDEEIVSFLLALVILHVVGINSASKRFALSEARRAEQFLKNDLKNASYEVKAALLKYIFKDVAGLEIINEDDTYNIKVAEYLKRASHFHDPYWKLINRDVYDGYVHLDVDDCIRLIREELSILIYDKINKINVSKVPLSISNRAETLRKSLINDKRFKPFIHAKREYPPCIVHILEMLDKGENPSHSERFLLATYMLSIGKNIDEVCSLFEHAPDYNEKITRYQVEYLAGRRRSGKSYNCPNCEKIATMHLCYKTDECNGIKSPLQFRKIKNE